MSGVRKNSTCRKLATIGGTSRNRVLTMPSSMLIHTPLIAISTKPGMIPKTSHVIGIEKIARPSGTISRLWASTMKLRQTLR